MQGSLLRADAGSVIRLLATVVVSAFLLSGCSTEGQRAQELLQQAEVAQAALDSATFEASIGAVMDGRQMEVAIAGAATKEGAAVSLRTTGIPGAKGKDVQLVVRDDRAWMKDTGGKWASMPVPTGLEGKSRSMGADAFQELARYVKDVRIAEHQPIGGKFVTTIAGEIDTVGMLQAVAKLGSLPGKGGTSTGFTLDLDDLGIDVGDIKAVLSIDERTHLLVTALITVAIEAQGETLQVKLQYRLTSSNQPVELPSVSG